MYVELRKLLEGANKDDPNYARKYFQFSILEICNLNMDDEYVLGRETHWKNALLSRSIGLNRN